MFYSKDKRVIWILPKKGSSVTLWLYNVLMVGTGELSRIRKRRFQEVQIQGLLQAGNRFQRHVGTAFQQIWNILLCAAHPPGQLHLRDRLLFHPPENLQSDVPCVSKPKLIIPPPLRILPPSWSRARPMRLQKFSCVAHSRISILLAKDRNNI